MKYSLTFSKHALKGLEKIHEPHYSSIKNVIINLTENPKPQGCKKLKGRDGFRVRVGNYRIIYDVNDEILIVDVLNIGHRKDIYR